MQRPEQLEQRLSSFSLTQSSDNYLPEGCRLIEKGITPAKSPWPLRLNYALGLCLILSVSFNVAQLADNNTDTLTAVADQCELHGTLQESALSPIADLKQVYDTPFSSSSISGQWC